MASDHRESVQRGLRIKKAGNAIVALLGGREIHPVNVRVGGFYRVPARAELEALLPELRAGRDAAAESLDWVAGFDFPAARARLRVRGAPPPRRVPVLRGPDRLVEGSRHRRARLRRPLRRGAGAALERAARRAARARRVSLRPARALQPELRPAAAGGAGAARRAGSSRRAATRSACCSSGWSRSSRRSTRRSGSSRPTSRPPRLRSRPRRAPPPATAPPRRRAASSTTATSSTRRAPSSTRRSSRRPRRTRPRSRTTSPSWRRRSPPCRWPRPPGAPSRRCATTTRASRARRTSSPCGSSASVRPAGRIVGLGQPAAGDDGVGLAVLDWLRERGVPAGVELAERPGRERAPAAARIAGTGRARRRRDRGAPGRVVELAPEELDARTCSRSRRTAWASRRRSRWRRAGARTVSHPRSGSSASRSPSRAGTCRRCRRRQRGGAPGRSVCRRARGRHGRHQVSMAGVARGRRGLACSGLAMERDTHGLLRAALGTVSLLVPGMAAADSQPRESMAPVSLATSGYLWLTDRVLSSPLVVGDLREYAADEILRDGGSIHIRAIRPDDRERLLEHFHRLSARSVYFRFFGAKRRLTDDELDRFTELGLRAPRRPGRDAARRRRGAHHRRRALRSRRRRAAAPAEVAFAVADEHQGRGIGTLLLEHLAADRARTRHHRVRGRRARREQPHARGLRARAASS